MGYIASVVWISIRNSIAMVVLYFKILHYIAVLACAQNKVSESLTKTECTELWDIFMSILKAVCIHSFDRIELCSSDRLLITTTAIVKGL